MIRSRAVTDTNNPPGQVRYLRDMIARYQEEEKVENRKEGAYNGFSDPQATLPLPDAEKRLQRLVDALESLLIEHEKRRNEYGVREGTLAVVASWKIRKIIKETLDK